MKNEHAPGGEGSGYSIFRRFWNGKPYKNICTPLEERGAVATFSDAFGTVVPKLSTPLGERGAAAQFSDAFETVNPYKI